MNGRLEIALAWTLLEDVKPHLTPAARTRYFAQLGAGDPEGVIRSLLDECVRSDRVLLSERSVSQLNLWGRGYAGTGPGQQLRQLIDRIFTLPRAATQIAQ